MDNQTIARLALRTDQWCHIFLMQTRRFLDAVEKGTGGNYPWEKDDKSSVFIGEKMFFVTALNHAVTHLCAVYKELKIRGDNAEELKNIIDKIGSEDFLKDIRDLRNMNEHDVDYLIGNGRAQEKFFCTVETGKYRYQTNAHATVLMPESFTVGKIQVPELVRKFQSQMPYIDDVCKRIFEKYN